jgi:hypothetical protein
MFFFTQPGEKEHTKASYLSFVNLLGFDERLEPQQSRVPFCADIFDPLIKLAERCRCKRVALFAPLLMHRNQSRIFENMQMLENPLARDRIIDRELGRRPGTVFGQVEHDISAHWIRKCISCDRTWKCTIFSRLDTRQVDRCLLRRLQANHRPAAWVYAFDYGLLRRNGVEVEPTIAYTIVGEDLKPYSYGQGCVTVLLMAEQPLLVRIDTLLARKLGLSRAQLGALFTSGGATIDSASGCALRDKLKRAVTILIDRVALRSYLFRIVS